MSIRTMSQSGDRLGGAMRPMMVKLQWSTEIDLSIYQEDYPGVHSKEDLFEAVLGDGLLDPAALGLSAEITWPGGEGLGMFDVEHEQREAPL